MIREDHAYLEHVASETFLEMSVSIGESEIQLGRKELLALPLAIRRRVIRFGLQHLNESWHSPRFAIIQRLLDHLEHRQSGWTLRINTVDVRQEYDRLVFTKRAIAPSNDWNTFSLREVSLGIPGEAVWPLTGQRMAVSVRHPKRIAKNPNSCEMHLDADTFTPELQIRNWRAGDVFCPKGMGGQQKKLQDFFSDIKLPRSQREKVPLLVSPEGILWVGGLRADERFQVSPSTTSVLIASMTE